MQNKTGRLIRYGAAANAGLHTLEMRRFLGQTGELTGFAGIFNSTCPYLLEKIMKAFCARKYNSDFAREMTRSVAKYLRQFEILPE